MPDATQGVSEKNEHRPKIVVDIRLGFTYTPPHEHTDRLASAYADHAILATLPV